MGLLFRVKMWGQAKDRRNSRKSNLKFKGSGVKKWEHVYATSAAAFWGEMLL